MDSDSGWLAGCWSLLLEVHTAISPPPSPPSFSPQHSVSSVCFKLCPSILQSAAAVVTLILRTSLSMFACLCVRRARFVCVVSCAPLCLYNYTCLCCSHVRAWCEATFAFRVSAKDAVCVCVNGCVFVVVCADGVSGETVAGIRPHPTWQSSHCHFIRQRHQRVRELLSVVVCQSRWELLRSTFA